MSSDTGAVQEWTITLPDGASVAVVDLPMADTLAAIADAQRASEVAHFNWRDAITAPLSHPGLATALYRLGCTASGQKPAKLTARELYDLVNLADSADGTFPPLEAPKGSQWALTLPDQEPVLLWDLPAGVMTQLSESLNVWWVHVIERPLNGVGATAKALVDTVAKRLDCDPPTGLTNRQFAAMWTLVDDDKPTSFVDGYPVPKAKADEDDPSTP